jgi:glycosyltransferase involved in cell wall biosynthesis
MTAISLVLCTRNRADRLARCLSHIKALRPSVHWELIVVDNGSSDSTPELLEKFARYASFPVQVLSEITPGLGRARNSGWQAATGEIVAFTDDDCYVLPNFLEEVLKVFADPKIGYCGGRIKLYDASDYPITINESNVPDLFPPYKHLAAGVVQGANMIFRRKTLIDIEGFDDTLGAGTPFPCEDIDACARATFAGWWGAYAPGPTVLHAHGRKAGDVAALSRSYAIARGAYAAKFILRPDTRRCYLRSWSRHLASWSRRPAPYRRECFYEIQGAIQYYCRKLFVSKAG